MPSLDYISPRVCLVGVCDTSNQNLIHHHCRKITKLPRCLGSEDPECSARVLKMFLKKNTPATAELHKPKHMQGCGTIYPHINTLEILPITGVHTHTHTITPPPHPTPYSLTPLTQSQPQRIGMFPWKSSPESGSQLQALHVETRKVIELQIGFA